MHFSKNKEMSDMTLQQEATAMINSLPDDGVQLMIDLMRRMINPIVIKSDEEIKNNDTSKRFGAGVGIINDPAGFDDMNKDVLDYFEAVDVV